jgi:hypothetical protein
LIVHEATDIDIASECSFVPAFGGPAVDELLNVSTRIQRNIECERVM